MNISSVGSGLPTPLLDALKRNTAAKQQGGGAEKLSNVDFVQAMDGALKSVSTQQAQATGLAQAFQKDPTSVSLETAMVSMQKAQIGFQSALHVRNRLVSAYSDIMNMQV